MVSERPPAASGSAIRRAGAMIGIVILLVLALGLMWRVYLHHQRSRSLPDEPSLVTIRHFLA